MEDAAPRALTHILDTQRRLVRIRLKLSLQSHWLNPLARLDSPGVLDQQGLDEVDRLRRDALKGVLRVVHVDLRDVEERLLLVVTQEWRLARQHDVGQDPDAPVVGERARGLDSLPTFRATSCASLSISR